MRTGFFKGAIAGALAGATIAIILDPITPKQRKRAARKAGYMVNDMKRAMRDVLPH